MQPADAGFFHMPKKRKDDALLEIEDYLKKPYVPYTSKFLDERQQASVLPALKKSDRKYFFEGGYPEAMRKILVLLPEYDENVSVPIAALLFDKPCRLSHSHVLGTILSLGIERDFIGDISIWEDKVQVIVHEQLLDYLLNNFTSILGRTIKPEALSFDRIIPYVPEYEERTNTVTSNRLDAILSRAFGISREKAMAAINRGDVSHNYLPAEKATRSVSPGDTISLRRKGKIRITEIGERTKKGKIRFNYQKYK